MTPLGLGATGLAVALGFALLGTRRTAGMTLLCAAQALVVAAGALAEGAIATALVACAEAAAVAWLGSFGGRWGLGGSGGGGEAVLLPLPSWEGGGGRGHSARTLDPSPQPPPTRGGGAVPPRPASTAIPPFTALPAGTLLAAGALLAALAATVPSAGLPLAVILLGLLVVAGRRLPLHQALGIAAAQNGLTLATVAAGRSGWSLALPIFPWLPALALAALWLGADRRRTTSFLAPRLSGRIDAALSAVVLLIACALPWHLGAAGPFWRVTPLSVHGTLLIATLATATAWAQRDATTVWGSRLAILAGTLLAILSTAPLPSWLGMALATTGAAAAALPARAEAWRRLRLGCTGLGLALFGAIALHTGTQSPATTTLQAAATPLAPIACIMLGYGTLAVLTPELIVAAIVLILRLRAPQSTGLLLALGLAALLVAALGLLTTRTAHRRTLPLVGLAQAGAAVFAFGLGTEAGDLAGLLQLSFLALTQTALALTSDDGLDRLAAIAGMAGLPPFGLFPSLALILVATAQTVPWLLLPLGTGLAAIAWTILRHLPSDRYLRASPAWLPLALLLLAGFAMPDPLLAWFRLAAR